MDEHKYLPTTRITQPAHSDHRCKLRYFKILLTVLGFRRPTAALGLDHTIRYSVHSDVWEVRGLMILWYGRSGGSLVM